MSSILLFNTSLQNRGDALMLEAVVRKLGLSHRWSIAADVAVVSDTPLDRFRTALISMLPGASAKQRLFNRAITIAGASAGVLPSGVRSRLPVVPISDIDVALDLSGYCFGDPWGEARIEAATRAYKRLREAGAKVILLPRTWGPFETIRSSVLDAMLEHVDLAFARDGQSHENISRMVSAANQAKLHYAPDYTHGVKPEPGRWPILPETALLIPSNRVIDSGTLTKQHYLALLSQARAQFAEIGLHPRLLIHETSNDLGFIEKAEMMGFSPNEVLVPENAIAAKSMISQATAVVTSRLHGLYNALNSHVPVGVIAWSFKYRQALAQYGCEDCLVDASNMDSSLREIVELITSSEHRPRLQDAMRRGRLASEAASADMWQKVERLLS